MKGNKGELSTGLSSNGVSRNSGFFVWDREQDRLQFCGPILQLLALTPAQARQGISFQRYMEMIHPDDRVRVRDEITRDGTSATFKRFYRVVRADGDVVALKVVGCQLRDEAGRTVQHLGSIDLLGMPSVSNEDELLGHTLSGYVLAEKTGNHLVQYLFGMALIDLGFQITQPPAG